MDWNTALKTMNDLAANQSIWKYGQENTIKWMAERLSIQNGVLIADEVGMGKTRVAMSAIFSVLKAGGSVATVVPPGLIFQWKKEWEDFLINIDEHGYKPIMLRSFDRMFDENRDFPLANKNYNNWLLISHNFGPPNLRINANPDRYILPVFVKALINEEKKVDRRNSYWQRLSEYFGWNECKNAEFDCKKCKLQTTECDYNWFKQLSKAAYFLKDNCKEAFNEKDFPDNGLDSNNAKQFFIDFFNNPEKGLNVIKNLIGDVDLLVIDEAHKNRDYEGNPKRLGTILRYIIGKKSDIKRIAITATPMELKTEQWKDMFARIGEDKNYPEKQIKEFKYFYEEANKNPDNLGIVNQYVEASKSFTNALKPFVTRRMRIDQPEMKALIGEKIKNAHPHRKWEEILIEFKNIEDDWKPVVFAFEAIGKTAKGLSVKDEELNKKLRKLKIADSRYSSGQMASEWFSSNDIVKSNQDLNSEVSGLEAAINDYLKDERSKEEDQSTTKKLLRLLYWEKVVNSGEANILNHPRILRVADSIENLVWDNNGSFKGEKVIVFGTFISPLKMLWDILNRRAVLRLLDRTYFEQEAVIPAVDTCIKNIEWIWLEYKRIKQHLKCNYESIDDLKYAIERGGRNYENLRKRMANYVDNNFIETLPGYAVIKELKDKVVDLLRARLVNQLICSDKDISAYKSEELKNAALSIWEEYVASYLDQEDEILTENTTVSVWKRPDYFKGTEEDVAKFVEQNRFVNNVGKEVLEVLLNDESESISGRVGMFARILFGEVKMEYRRVIQAQFNQKESFPMVLIAQSQVGREGLNLHRECDIVIQLHSEWNPAIIEQQIGRVDRIDSLWEKKARKWYENGKNGIMPTITIIPVVFEGTYDSYQFGVSKKRRETLNAYLFGELFTEEAIEKLPKDAELLQRIQEAAPRFAPPISHS